MRRPSLSGARVLLAIGCFVVVSKSPGGTSRANAVRDVGRNHTIQAASWFDAAWRHRIKITANAAMIEGLQLEFPLLLSGGTLQSVFARAKADGSDILITKRDGTTPLDHEIIDYDASQSQAQIWFEADSLSDAVREFYVYYDNPGATVTPAGPAWNETYEAVYHFEENPGLGTLRDYSGQGHNASSGAAQAQWTSNDVTNGQMGQAWLFNGTSHFINTRAIRIPDSTYVISAWLQLTTRSTDFTFQSNPNYWHVSAQTNNIVQLPHFNHANPWRDMRWTPSPLPLDGEFHYFTWVFDGVADTIQFYYDGQEQPATLWAADPPVHRYYTGFQINPNGNFDVGICGPMYWNSLDLMDGPGDEFRVSEGRHSSTWIATEYANQRDPGAFWSASPEEGSTPVFLQSFRVERMGAEAVLSWQVSAASADHLGFHVVRDEGGPWTRISPALLSGQSAYRFVDPRPPASGANYWLEEHTLSGNVLWYGPVVLDPTHAGSLMLEPSQPNPLVQGTVIRFVTGVRGAVHLRLFDVRGREVHRLVERTLDPGMHVVDWDGRDASGQRLQPGVYWLRLDGTEGTRTHKLVVM